MLHVTTPAYRHSDPATSEQAATHVTNSGIRRKQQQAALAAVLAHPGHTSHELATLSGLDRYALARRLPECATAGVVYRGAPKTCDVTGRSAVTWWPTADRFAVAA